MSRFLNETLYPSCALSDSFPLHTLVCIRERTRSCSKTEEKQRRVGGEEEIFFAAIIAFLQKKERKSIVPLEEKRKEERETLLLFSSKPTFTSLASSWSGSREHWVSLESQTRATQEGREPSSVSREICFFLFFPCRRRRWRRERRKSKTTPTRAKEEKKKTLPNKMKRKSKAHADKPIRFLIHFSKSTGAQMADEHVSSLERIDAASCVPERRANSL